jgi:alcohol dehydrogenase class IV
MGFITRNVPLHQSDFSSHLPTQVKFGLGKIGKLGLELQIESDLYDRNNVVLVTDKGVAGAGLVSKAELGLADSHYEIKAIFDSVPPDSDLATVRELTRVLQGQEADLIIALGGGSVMDTAKAGSVLAAHGGEIADYEGGFMVPGPCIPIVAIPTTAGTGSEVSMGAVIKDPAARVKITIASPFLFPRLAVLDPEMVRTLPARLMAWTGMDALTHCIEAYVSDMREPVSEALALRSVEMIFDNLEPAVKDAANIDARAKMQLAATMAGMAFSNAALGAVHPIAHAVGAMFGVHHGLGNAVALPAVMEYNLEVCPERFASLARAMSVGLMDAPDEKLGRLAIDRVRDLNRALGIPGSYRELGVPADVAAIEAIAEAAMNDPLLAFNPRKTELEDMIALVAKTVRGKD